MTSSPRNVHVNNSTNGYTGTLLMLTFILFKNKGIRVCIEVDFKLIYKRRNICYYNLLIH